MTSTAQLKQSWSEASHILERAEASGSDCLMIVRLSSENPHETFRLLSLSLGELEALTNALKAWNYNRGQFSGNGPSEADELCRKLSLSLSSIVASLRSCT